MSKIKKSNTSSGLCFFGSLICLAIVAKVIGLMFMSPLLILAMGIEFILRGKDLKISESMMGAYLDLCEVVCDRSERAIDSIEIWAEI